ncbi:MAG: HepT-like ribonuclease domain-containing protein [Betaproteobacteria bacterium]
MSRRAEQFLADILDAITSIEDYAKGGEAAFRKDRKARDAAQMRLIEIGEATKRIQELGLKLSEIEPGIEWSKIAGMRDVIAHHYWRVSESLLWDTVRTSLPPLKDAVRRLQKKRLRGRKSGKLAE